MEKLSGKIPKIRTLGFTIFLIYMIGFANTFAQNEAYLEQKGSKSTATITQIGSKNILTGPGNMGNDAAQQKSVWGSNTLVVNQLDALNKSEITLSQSALLNNDAEINQTNGITNIIDLTQISALHNNAILNQVNGGYNSIEIEQQALLRNNVNVFQENGSHTFILDEKAGGSNESHAYQGDGSGYAWIERVSLLNNIIPDASNTLMDNPDNRPGIYQQGLNNFITGAVPTGNPLQPTLQSLDLPAEQISALGYNWLEIWQTGNNNNAGLFQEAGFNNTALINQYNGDNNLAVHQTAAHGSNYLQVEQAGGKSVSIYQNAVSGDNIAIIKQN